ncbi:MAG: hypothetical protein PHI12_09790 [Dehalococcoidales bacterium]|nr:hypothetical protein [Dehalococcoidales bacterium]
MMRPSEELIWVPRSLSEAVERILPYVDELVSEDMKKKRVEIQIGEGDTVTIQGQVFRVAYVIEPEAVLLRPVSGQVRICKRGTE